MFNFFNSLKKSLSHLTSSDPLYISPRENKGFLFDIISHQISVIPNQEKLDKQRELFFYEPFLAVPELQEELSKIRIAILDTGIDFNHNDLYSAIFAGSSFVPNQPWYVDGNGHGTHCAGILAGSKGGLIPNAKLLIAKVLQDNGTGKLEWITEGINWAIGNKADIISLSLGCSSYDKRIFNAIQAANCDDIIVVCAAGNHGNKKQFNVSFPATTDAVIRVGSVNSDGHASSFSAVGRPTVDVAVLGEHVLSTFKDNTYCEMSGTSMSTPYASGVCAYLLAYDRVRHIASQIRHSPAYIEDTHTQVKTSSACIQNIHCLKSLLRRITELFDNSLWSAFSI